MRLFLYPEEDSIANTSVKTPLNSVDFSEILQFLNLLSFWPSATSGLVLQNSRWRIKGELNFHKKCTEAREIKISAGNLERTYPKGFRQDIPRTE